MSDHPPREGVGRVYATVAGIAILYAALSVAYFHLPWQTNPALIDWFGLPTAPFHTAIQAALAVWGSLGAGSHWRRWLASFVLAALCSVTFIYPFMPDVMPLPGQGPSLMRTILVAQLWAELPAFLTVFVMGLVARKLGWRSDSTYRGEIAWRISIRDVLAFTLGLAALMAAVRATLVNEEALVHFRDWALRDWRALAAEFYSWAEFTLIAVSALVAPVIVAALLVALAGKHVRVGWLVGALWLSCAVGVGYWFCWYLAFQAEESIGWCVGASIGEAAWTATIFGALRTAGWRLRRETPGALGRDGVSPTDALASSVIDVSAEFVDLSPSDDTLNA